MNPNSTKNKIILSILKSKKIIFFYNVKKRFFKQLKILMIKFQKEKVLNKENQIQRFKKEI